MNVCTYKVPEVLKRKNNIQLKNKWYQRTSDRGLLIFYYGNLIYNDILVFIDSDL